MRKSKLQVLSLAGTFLEGGGGAGGEPGRSIPNQEQDTVLGDRQDRRLGMDLSERKSEVQVLSPARTFLGEYCCAGVEPGRSTPSRMQDNVLQCDRRKAGDSERISE